MDKTSQRIITGKVISHVGHYDGKDCFRLIAGILKLAFDLLVKGHKSDLKHIFGGCTQSRQNPRSVESLPFKVTLHIHDHCSFKNID